MWSFFDCDQMQCIIFPVLYKHFNNMLVFKNWVFHSKVLPCIVVVYAPRLCTSSAEMGNVSQCEHLNILRTSVLCNKSVFLFFVAISFKGFNF